MNNSLSMLTLSANTYGGGTTVSGTLQLGSATALPGGALAANGGVLDLAGQGVTVSSFSGAAGTVTTSVASPVTLTVNQIGSTVFGGALQNGSGQLSLAFSGGAGPLRHEHLQRPDHAQRGLAGGQRPVDQ